MNSRANGLHGFLAIALLVAATSGVRLQGGGLLRIATFNLENYLIEATPDRSAKPSGSRRKIQQMIRDLDADLVVLQEIGGTASLDELRHALHRQGVDYPYWELVNGHDSQIQVAILSRLPFIDSRPRTNDGFLLHGRRFRMSRGIIDVDVRLASGYRFTLLSTHLKSRRPVAVADESELREQEALILRERIDAHLAANPRGNLIVLGDFNDLPNSRTVRTLLGRGAGRLIDTRPAERNGDERGRRSQGRTPRTVAWTYHYARDDTYSRADYILLSPGMAKEWVAEESYVLSSPHWGTASDHRPLVAAFHATDQ